MFKYMKYEIKGTYRYILGVLALVLTLITGIYLYMHKGYFPTRGGSPLLVLLPLVFFGTALTTFLYIVGSFRRELYEDTGYLTFTLPLTGKQIVGAKLTVALLWFFLLGTTIALYNLLMLSILNTRVHSLLEILTALAQTVPFMQLLYSVSSTVLKGFNLLLLIYFAMALSRVTFRNKKIGGIWFVIFLILSALLSYGEFLTTSLLSQYLDLNINPGTLNSLNQHLSSLPHGFTISLATGILNLASSIYLLITTVLLFLSTSYLVEKKIDL